MISMQDNPPTTPPEPTPPSPADLEHRRQVRIAGMVLGGVLLFFALVAVLMFIFRWQLMPDPWQIL